MNSWVTVISFLVRVPVLSEQMTLQHPEERKAATFSQSELSRDHRSTLKAAPSAHPESRRLVASSRWPSSVPSASRQAPTSPSQLWAAPLGWQPLPDWHEEGGLDWRNAQLTGLGPGEHSRRYLTPMVNMSRILFPCSQPTSIITPGQTEGALESAAPSTSPLIH